MEKDVHFELMMYVAWQMEMPAKPEEEEDKGEGEEDDRKEE